MNRARVQSILIDVIAYGHELANPVMSRVLENGCTNYIDMMTDEIIEAVEHGIELCTVEESFTKPSTLDNMQEYLCHRCGRYFFFQVLSENDKPGYCTRCGAKVVPND